MEEALPELKNLGVETCTLSADGKTPINEFKIKSPVVYVLGNETTGVSEDIRNICSRQIRIPMNNGVESLNVAVAAALLAFHSLF